MDWNLGLSQGFQNRSRVISSTLPWPLGSWQVILENIFFLLLEEKSGDDSAGDSQKENRLTDGYRLQSSSILIMQ